MKRMTNIGALIAVSLIVASCGSSSMNPFSRPASRTGTFSDLFMHAPTGEVIGVEIRIVETSTGYQGALQIGSGTAGGLSPLVIVDVYYEDEDSLSFSVPADHAWAGRFEGNVRRDGLVGTFTLSSGEDRFVVLDRGRSFWD